MKFLLSEEKQEESSCSENETLHEEVEGANVKLEWMDENMKTNEYNFALPQHFECETCGKSFTSKLKLSRHSLCHTNFKCSICFKGFRMSSMLHRHMSTTHKEQFKCDLCVKNFITSSLLRKHTLNRHSIVRSKNTNSKNLEGLKPVPV